MIETVNFRYNFTFAEFRMNYERELAESPYWRKFTIICILVFALGLLLGCILTNLTPWFDQTWSVLGVIPWIIGCLPVVIYYRKTRVDVRKAYQSWTWDGAELRLGFDLDRFFIQTESTYREYKWKNAVDIIKETQEEIIIGKKEVYLLQLKKTKIEDEKVIHLREILQRVSSERELPEDVVGGAG